MNRTAGWLEYRRVTATARVLAVAVAVSCFAGCGASSAPSPATGNGSVAWQNFKQINPQAGIDEATLSYGIWGDGMAFIVVSDIAGSSGESIGGSGSPSLYHGAQKSPDGRQVEWNCETKDGKSGVITINGKSYDLVQGSLFLVATKGSGVRVVQLKRDTLMLKRTKKNLEALVRDDPDIGKFFATAPVPK